MRAAEVLRIEAVLGGAVVATRTLAGGFSHETSLLTLTDGARVVVRIGGPDPRVEAAVMAVGGQQVPVPEVLRVLPAEDGARPAMVLAFVPGTPLEQVLSSGGADVDGLGAEVGRVLAAIGVVRFDRPGFFADDRLTVPAERPWSQQLPEVAASCMDTTPRLDPAERKAWVELCTAHAPDLVRVDHDARLVHADINPKNILVSRSGSDWRVDAVLDWEFSYSGCPYGDAANMARFGDGYPAGFLDAFQTAFANHYPGDLADDWIHLGHVLDMFALSDLVTRPLGHPIADQAATRIRHLLA